jgi:hypothetical protein
MLVANGYGSASPIAGNDTLEGRFRNRRIGAWLSARGEPVQTPINKLACDGAARPGRKPRHSAAPPPPSRPRASFR